MTTEAEVQCPASMCPLVATDGSPWTGEYGAACPEHDDMATDGCPFWSMACSCGGVQGQVEEAARQEGRMMVVGPNKPKRLMAAPRTYECEKAAICSWQKQAGDKLCPPRDALARGMDPRVCLF